jgi:hypothetical protein
MSLYHERNAWFDTNIYISRHLHITLSMMFSTVNILIHGVYGEWPCHTRGSGQVRVLVIQWRPVMSPSRTSNLLKPELDLDTSIS